MSDDDDQEDDDEEDDGDDDDGEEDDDDDDDDDDTRGCASEGERSEEREMREEGVEYKRRDGQAMEKVGQGRVNENPLPARS